MGNNFRRKLSKKKHQDLIGKIDELKEINECREKLGLKPIETKPRFCLKCDSEFVSYQKNNFLCENCGEKIGHDEWTYS